MRTLSNGEGNARIVHSQVYSLAGQQPSHIQEHLSGRELPVRGKEGARNVRTPPNRTAGPRQRLAVRGAKAGPLGENTPWAQPAPEQSGSAMPLVRQPVAMAL